MRGFPQNAVCVVGLSKAPSQNPITFVHQSLIGSFVVDNTTGRIYAVQFNTICGITSNFLEEQLVGLSLLSDIGRNAQAHYDPLPWRFPKGYYCDPARCGSETA